ncbi:MAG: nucleoside deaminase [Erysipelotrichaceae bacterium]|nr:nucleoside deaminase [Erysipelotrichaceae bacterium]
MKKDHNYFMNLALKEAEKAALEDEVPVGAVVVCDDKVIARAHNQRDKKNLTYAHAEMLAIIKANKKLGSWRMPECDIYITLEPCIMCMGAIIQSRIKNIYYGAKDPKGGAVISSINVLEANNINHHPNVVGGILEEQCSKIITNYFKNKRKKTC